MLPEVASYTIFTFSAVINGFVVAETVTLITVARTCAPEASKETDSASPSQTPPVLEVVQPVWLPKPVAGLELAFVNSIFVILLPSVVLIVVVEFL